MSSGPGRNDPCPCGSGKKFKHCCLAAHDKEDAARVRLRSAEGRLLMPLFKFAVERWGQALLQHAWEDFWNYSDVPDDMDGMPEFEPMFVPWFTLWFVPDPEAENVDPRWPTQALGLEWLATPGTIVPALDRVYVETACRSPMSAFVVEQVVPGRSLDVKDILTGRHFHVLELTASRSLQVADVVFSRVVTIDGTSILLGMGPFVAPLAWHGLVLDWREHYFKKRLATRHDLDRYEIEVRDLYLDAADAVLNPPLPVLTNTDGDEMEHVTLTYALHAPVAQAREKLLPLATLKGEVHESGVTADATGAVVGVELAWVKAGSATTAAFENTVLGTLRLDAGQLVAHVNSARRATRLKRMIATRLGAMAVLTGTTRGDPLDGIAASAGALGAAAGPTRSAPGESAAELNEAFSLEELVAFQEELEARYWKEWLTMPVPALQNKTPRQAARSASGRERLQALLSEFERRPGPGAKARLNHITAIRAALKLTKQP